MQKTSFLPLLFCLALSQLLLAQSKLPVIRATSKNARIVEGRADETVDWWLNPKVRPDVHVISKSGKPKWVTFYTDIDHIKTRLRPGQQFDFIVLLNGKDSCYTRIENKAPISTFARQVPASHDTIPFILTEYNNIKIRAVLNHTDTLWLKFDSGATGLLLTREAILHKTALLAAQAGVREGQTRPDYNALNPYNTLQLGGLSWDSLAIYPVELSGQGTDGRFGWDFFDGRVVEMDYDKKLFIIHSSLPRIPRGYSKMPIEYSHSLLCIPGVLEAKGIKYPNRFLFDNGYQRTIMLDTTLMVQQHFPTDLKVIKKTIMQNGQGKEFPVLTVNNERLILGNTTLPNIPAQQLSTGNPARFPVHILGNEVLKRFNTILDFYHNFIYLKPNQLKDLPYTDAS